jgi:tRNA(Ile)-lysidine synthase
VQLNPPPGAAIESFSQSIERLVGYDSRLLLAISGGPDSLALLLLAHAAMPARIAAATVDHGLRPEAAAETAYVAQLCAQLGIAHQSLYPAEPISGSVQANARAVRYALLSQHAAEHDCAFIATAHHADDQLETILMRVARGSGVDGLSAVRERRGAIIRPLLSFSKAELAGICAQCGVDPVNDPSNGDMTYDRVAMRQWLATTTHPFDAKRAVATAQSMADASEALNWITHELAQTRIRVEDQKLRLDPNGLPIELRRRLLLRMLGILQPDYVPRGEAVERALDMLGRGEQLTLGNALCKGGTSWQICAAPPRKQNRD